jgi:von Willebrand factor type A domain
MFERCIENQDQISLITYSKNCRRLFSLVEKERNYEQLRNQIVRLEDGLKGSGSANLLKAIKEAVREFIDQDQSAMKTADKRRS